MKRVITYGTFDLLHYGHINLLRRAKALGDYLIVALSTDEFNWNSKNKKTYFSYEQRKQLLESIRYVDLVIPEENWNQKFIFFERCSLALQIFLHVNRVKNLDWKVKLGGNWCSVTNDFVSRMLQEEPKLLKLFKWTNCSDELLVQTIAFNCGFMNRMYHNPNGADNLRFIDWVRSKNGSSHTFTIADKELLEDATAGALIARKFSLDKDSEIINYILKKTVNK